MRTSDFRRFAISHPLLLLRFFFVRIFRVPTQELPAFLPPFGRDLSFTISPPPAYRGLPAEAEGDCVASRSQRLFPLKRWLVSAPGPKEFAARKIFPFLQFALPEFVVVFFLCDAEFFSFFFFLVYRSPFFSRLCHVL